MGNNLIISLIHCVGKKRKFLFIEIRFNLVDLHALPSENSIYDIIETVPPQMLLITDWQKDIFNTTRENSPIIIWTSFVSYKAISNFIGMANRTRIYFVVVVTVNV